MWLCVGLVVVVDVVMGVLVMLSVVMMLVLVVEWVCVVEVGMDVCCWLGVVVLGMEKILG